MTNAPRMFSFRSSFASLLALAFCGSALAATPNLARITPRGGQRGSEMEVFFDGGRLSDTKEIFLYDPGITVLKLEVVNDNRVKCKLKIDPTAQLGEHRMRVRTASGISELQTFSISQFPTVVEKEPNSDFKNPQKIPLNVTVEGTVEYEDVDFYMVEAKKGQRITAEVEGIRLGNTLFDPYISIMDTKRFELSVSDDSSFGLQDGVASIIAPADGQYVVQVRESAYGGNGACCYRVHIGTFPRPSTVFPLGGKAGDEVNFQFLGDISGPFFQKVKLPANPMLKMNLFALQNGFSSPLPNPIRVSDVPNVMEVEPNDDVSKATPITLAPPFALNGIISKKGDVDWFKFKAKKGQVWDVFADCRRLRSPLDPVLYICNKAGSAIVANDDAFGPDSYVRFPVPSDDEYTLFIFDHLRKGGPEYTYRVEFRPVEPRLTVSIPQVSQSSQERQTIPVPRGNRFATLILANRANFGGELGLKADGLPPGVTLLCENMPANSALIPVVFEAAADAPLNGKLCDINANVTDPKQKISGKFEQTVDLVTGPPNITVYYKTVVEKLAVAVTEEAPFKIRVIEPKVPLVHNGALNLKVVAERKAGFTGAINVYSLFNPPNVGSAYAVTIPAGQNEVIFPMNANSAAEVRKWKLALLGQTDIGKGPIWVSTQPFNLEIAPAFVGMKIEMAAVEQGKPADLVCKLQQTTPFEGQAKVQVLGLPAQVTTSEMVINKDTKELVFKLKTAPTSPAGQHATVFCQLTVMKNNEPIIHYIGQGGVLRIDPPPPPKKNEPAVVAKAAAPPPVNQPAPKRLTRLEQLRLEQQERAKTAAKRS